MLGVAAAGGGVELVLHGNARVLAAGRAAAVAREETEVQEVPVGVAAARLAIVLLLGELHQAMEGRLAVKQR